METSQLVQYIVSGVTMGSIYAIVGFGFTIIYSVTGIINFAQGEFVMLGAMISYSLLGLGLPLPAAFVLTVVLVTLIGAAFNLLAIRPARNASTISLIIITIGGALFIRAVSGLVWGRDAVALPPFTGNESISFLGAYIQPQSLWVIGLTLLLMVSLYLLMNRTLVGKALKAAALNRRAAALVGIDARTMSLISFALAAATGAVCGIVIAPISFAYYDMGVMLGLKGFVAAAMGGFTGIWGVFLGGLGLGLAESLGAGYISSAYKDAIALVFLFAVLLIRSRSLVVEEEET
ncbi:MAG: branched-chain amino acid ABC transporter permease [Chloroflexota bacterium]|nr:branched-chain amino acid ABC transporter permease [Chloroflexota bacterium]